MRWSRLTTAAALSALLAASLLPAVAGTSAGAEPSVKYKVAMTISTKKATVDEDPVTIKGSITPATAKSKVIVQVQYEGSKAWKKAASVKVSDKGTYKYTFTPTTRTDRLYRVVKPGDDKATKGISKEKALQTIGWVYLSAMVPSASENISKISSMPINGDDYPKTIFEDVTQTTAFAEYTLGHHAYLFEGTFGLSDRTATGGKGTITVKNDGSVAFSQTFDLGQSSHQSIDVSSVFRIRIDFSQVADTPPSEPSAGAPRVLMD